MEELATERNKISGMLSSESASRVKIDNSRIESQEREIARLRDELNRQAQAHQLEIQSLKTQKSESERKQEAAL